MPSSGSPAGSRPSGIKRDAAALHLRGRVLLVDDDDDVREMAALVLADAGYEVLCAADGAAGLRLLHEHGPASRVEYGPGIGLLIADYAMPGMNGLELIRTARAVWPALPILLVSGYSRIDVVRAMAGPAAAAFLRKPFRAPELLARVAGLAGQAHEE
jgi:CheY-like chemotaxis protein